MRYFLKVSRLKKRTDGLVEGVVQILMELVYEPIGSVGLDFMDLLY
jgi:hypothetical protein